MNNESELKLELLKLLNSPGQPTTNAEATEIMDLFKPYLSLTKPESVEQPDSICKENDGCPTEKAVLQRFWRAINKPVSSDELDRVAAAIAAVQNRTHEMNDEDFARIYRKEAAGAIAAMRVPKPVSLAAGIEAMKIYIQPDVPAILDGYEEAATACAKAWGLTVQEDVANG